jgi:hypothetical protein
LLFPCPHRPTAHQVKQQLASSSPIISNFKGEPICLKPF